MSVAHPYASRPGHDAPARGGRQLVTIAVFVAVVLNVGPWIVNTLVDRASSASSVSVVQAPAQPAG